LISGDHRGAGRLNCLANGETCEILIGLQELNCLSDYVQYDQAKITNILTHEVGHSLGLLHNSNEDHLMYGNDETVQDNFDTLGLNIPTFQEENFVGRQPLQTQHDSLSQQFQELDSEYEKIYSEYETFLKEYDLTPETVVNSVDTGESEILTLTVAESVEKINDIINEKNAIGEETNLFAEKLRCYPDIKN